MKPIHLILVLATLLTGPSAAQSAPQAQSSTTQQPRLTIYVSKLANNTDGSSWANAFTTIQAALNAVPDDRGGCRIAVRPDTYFEAMLYPAHKGAAGAYNELVGDTDGSLGSGTTGRVIIDSGDPEQQGFKSYDWWGTVRSYTKGWSKEHTEETFSAIGWDRWRWRNLYVTGGDAGIFFDTTDQVKPFSVVVEDCVGIGRAFGGGVGNCLSRPEEPITFRRCHLWALDWWGDTAGAYVRVENTTMPRQPDAVFEDCVMAGPQCALKSSNYGFHTHSHIKLVRCRLIALNFSQPQGTPTDGIIQSVEEGKLLHVDLEDCTVMGYKVFGVKVKKETAGEISYTTRGDVKAYVQYQQEMPKGFHRLSFWPADVFQSLVPPEPKTTSRLTNRELIRRDLCEITPFVWKGKLCTLESIRPAAWGKPADHYLLLKEAESGKELARTAQGFGLACLLLHKDIFYIFASRLDDGRWRDVTLFKSSDLKHWDSKAVVTGENEEIFNSSVCRGRDGFVMAYESNDPAYPPFTIKFARSADLERWEKMPDAMFGTNRYTACPCLRYADGWYYVLYLEHRTPRWTFETYITRSRDLLRWELSAANPVQRAEGLDEGINASDPDIVEFQGKTLLYFCVSDQLSWMNIKRVIYPGTMAEFFKSWYAAPGIPDWGTPAEARAPAH
ncbi:MAG: hypothetical protein A2W03_08540 [Candidatus Aminicenantes bacterium RBG_16_63_16]|nr:MAG: hypothetical protein A2W03_08540 [Candidatus Aminicenantes bacterium RBG_16_63_16]